MQEEQFDVVLGFLKEGRGEFEKSFVGFDLMAGQSKSLHFDGGHHIWLQFYYQQASGKAQTYTIQINNKFNFTFINEQCNLILKLSNSIVIKRFSLVNPKQLMEKGERQQRNSAFLYFIIKNRTFNSQTNRNIMEKNQQKKIYVYPLERLSLQPLSLNVPFPHKYSPTSSLEALFKHRSPLVQTDRQENSSSVRTLSGIKQILSKSLFHKKPPRTTLTQQKLKDDLTFVKSDTKPISPESQQKEPLQADKHIFTNEPHFFDDTDNEGRFSNTDEILDTKFNKIMDLQDPEFDLQIESKFTTKRSPKSFKGEHDEIELMEPCVTFSNLLEHERLLEEENGFIREQLIIFTDIIDGQRTKANDYKHKAKTLKKQNINLREQNKVFQAQLFEKQQKFYNLTVQNQEYKIQIQSLTQGKDELSEKFQQLSKDFEQICFRLQNYESIKDKEIQSIVEEKNKEKQVYTEEIMQKYKEIQEMNDIIDLLKNKIAYLEGSPKSVQKDKVNNSIQEDRLDECEEEELEVDKMMTSSICLSLADAESLKNIIEAKQQMFHKQLEILRCKNINEERSNTKIIEQLTTRIKRYEEQFVLTSRTQKKEDCDIQLLKLTFTKRINALQLYLQEEREQNQRLHSQLNLLEQRYENIQKDQDDQLEDLLEKCVNQLQKERNANYLLREEITGLKRTFAKELYYIKSIENNVYIN